MITKTLDDVMRRMLNDPDIFGPPYDRDRKSSIPLLFETKNWKQLKNGFKRRDKNSFSSLVDNHCYELQQKEQNAKGWRRNQIRNIISLGESLRKAYDRKPYILEEMFDKLDSFGVIECKLPKMENFGKVIENHNRSTGEQYFLSKIDKARGYQKRALRKTLEYVKELYAMNLDILEIAFFTRKPNSLTQFVEVIKDE